MDILLNGKGKGIRVVVIDSGIASNHEVFNGESFQGIGVVEANGIILANSDINDNLGHGTAIAHIIKKYSPEVELFIIKIFQNTNDVNFNSFKYALEYVRDNIDCDVINLSLGFSICLEARELNELCTELIHQGKMIVSAYHHDGSLSYPAQFENVIGVEMGTNCKNDLIYEYLENDFINIIGRNGKQKLASLNSTYQFVEGSSYSTAYITAFIANIMSRGIKKLDEIKGVLRKGAKKIHKSNYEHTKHNNWEKVKVKSAVVFPYNKEVHSLIRFSDLLPFELSDITDLKYTGKIGNVVASEKNNTLYKINNLYDLDWTKNFDTFIVGHIKPISDIVNVDLLTYIVNKCIQYKKNLYSFDSLSEYKDELKEAEKLDLVFYYPEVSKKQIPPLRFGKLSQISKPIIGIFGTSSMQGKFTLQLKLRSLFQEKGYIVGQLGTEPTSLLFGIDEIYPMGYNSILEVHGHDAISTINYMLYKIESKNPDVIIVGSQSNTIPEYNSNLIFYPTKQLEFLLGTMPDLVILSVNIDEDIDHIHDTIKSIEGLSKAKVIALVIYPVIKKITINNLYKLSAPTTDQLKSAKEYFEKCIQLDTYILNNSSDMDSLFNSIVDHLT